MRKNNSFKCIFLLILALGLIALSFKDRVHSKTDGADVTVESNPQDIAINPETNIAVVAVERGEDGHHDSKSSYAAIIDLTAQTVISKIPVGRQP